MSIIRTYLSGCTWCNAKGFVNNPNDGWSTELTVQCPVCNGSKTVIVTETIPEDVTALDQFVNPPKD